MRVLSVAALASCDVGKMMCLRFLGDRVTARTVQTGRIAGNAAVGFREMEHVRKAFVGRSTAGEDDSERERDEHQRRKGSARVDHRALLGPDRSKSYVT